MAEQTGFHLHHSNQLNLLAQRLGENLASGDGARHLLQPDIILIPQPSMRRWLQKTLAEQFGIAANLEFLPPGSFIHQQLEGYLPKQLPLLSPDVLRWRLFSLLQNQSLMALPVFSALQAFMQAGDSQLRAWQLAGELSDAYEKYQAWRKQWLINWHHQDHAQDWQAKLWFLASQGHCFRAQAFQQYFKAIEHARAQKPSTLPERFFVFACQSLSPDVLKVIRSLAQWSDVHFYLHNPCLAYWGDVQKPQTAEQWIALQGDNALLNQSGRAGRDFVATLLSEQSPYDIDDDADYQEFDSSPNSLLQQIQSDILHRQSPTRLFSAFSPENQDDSIQIHSCHTPLREIQVLRAQLLALFEKYPDLMPGDVAVMAPNLENYAPYFEAVFQQQQSSYPMLPFTLSDQILFAESTLAQLIFRLLALAQSRFTSNEGFELISNPYIANYYGLQKTDLERIHDWLAQAEIRWGLDQGHRQRIDGVSQTQFTWQQGLQRLLLGYVSSQTTCIDETAPILAPIGQDQRLLDVLFDFTAFIDHLQQQFAQHMDASQWQRLLQTLLQKYTPIDELEDQELEAHNRLNLKINQLPDLVKNLDQPVLLGIALISDYLNDEGEQRLSQAWLSGRITVCKMVPMRLIPFKVICLLGMNEHDFPRPEQSAAINRLMSKDYAPMLGDRNNREDDRFLFLQLLSACQRHFYLSYIGRSTKDNSEQTPSVVIKELLDNLCAYFPNPEACAKQFILHHPLHVFEATLQTDTRACRLLQAQQAPVRNELPLFASVFDGVFETQQEPCVISIEQLKAFWQRPIQHLAKSKGIRLQRDDLLLEENEPYGKLEGLDAYQLKQRIFDNALQSTPATDAELTRQLQAEGLLAPGRLGLHTYHAHAERLVPAMTTLQPLRIEPIMRQLDLALSHARVQGELLQYYANGLIYNRGSKPMRAKDQLRSGFDALLARASDLSLSCFDFTKNKLTQRSMAFTPHQAQQALEVIVALYREGQTKILCFDAEISFAFYQDKIKNPDLDVRAWLLDTQAKENEDYTPAFDQSLDFLTYGQGFISEIAMKNPLQFESLAMHIFRPIMGVARDD